MMQKHIDDLTDADLTERIQDRTTYTKSVYTREIFEIFDDHDYYDEDFCYICTMPNDKYFDMITDYAESDQHFINAPLNREE
jgi:hypothetical protein